MKAINLKNCKESFCAPLSCREVQVLRHIILGYISKQIGKLLKLSFRTVETYINNVKTKLECQSKGEVIRKVLTTDLIYQLNILK